MKQILLALLLSLLAPSLWAGTLTEGFENVAITDADGQPLTSKWAPGAGLSNGWKVIGGSIYSSDSYGDYGLWSTAHTGEKSLVANYGSKNNAFVVVPTKLMGELKFWARKTSSSSKYTGTVNIYEVEEAEGSYTVKSTLSTFTLTTTWKEYSLDLGVEGRLVAINMVRSAMDDVEYTPYEAATEPIMETRVSGKAMKNYVCDFGLLAQDSTATFSLANVGAGVLQATLTAPDGFSVSPASLSVTAGQEEPFSITMSAADAGYKQGVVVLTADGQDSVKIGVKGLARDPDKVYLDFDALPQGWTLNEYGLVKDSVLQALTWNDAELTSPVLESGEGEVLFFRCSAASEASYQKPMAKVAYSEDGETWTEIGGNLAENVIYNRWQNIYVQNIPATATHLRLTLRYVLIDDLYGFALPKKAIMKVEAADYDFGMTDRDSTCHFTVTNVGTRLLTGLKALASDDNFIVTVPDTLQPGQTAQLALTLKALNQGMRRSVITVTADEQDTVTFQAMGYVADTTAVWLSLKDGCLPPGWSNKGWTLARGMAYAGYGGSHDVSILSPQLYIADGDSLVIRARGEYPSSWISLSWSVDDGQTWKAVKEFSAELSDTLRTLTITSLPKGAGRLRIDGSYAYLAGLNGTHIAAAQMEVMLADSVLRNRFTDDFGAMFAPVSHTYTIHNSGTGTLKGAISMSNNGFFTLSADSFALAPDDMMSLIVAPVFGDSYGIMTSDMSFEPADTTLRQLTVTLVAETRDSALWHEEFEKGLPDTWTNKGWTVCTPPCGNGTQMAMVGQEADNALVTPRLKAKAGEVLVLDFISNAEDASLSVDYSADEKTTWTHDETLQPHLSATKGRYTFTAPADGLYFLRFKGYNCALDNFYGFAYEPNAPVPNGISNMAAGRQHGHYLYDLSGRRVNAHTAQPGIYIQGGKKIVRR